MIPPLVLTLAHEARRFGALIVVRECGHSNYEHVDIFDAPDALVIQLWDAGFRASEYRADYWIWCASFIDNGRYERPTTPP